MRIPVSKSDLESGPIKQISKSLAKAWPSPLTYMQAADKVAQLFGYRNLHEMQQLAEPAVSERIGVDDVKIIVLITLRDQKVLSKTEAGALINSLPLHLIDAANVESPVEKTLTRPGAVEVLNALIREANRPTVRRVGRLIVVPVSRLLEGEDIMLDTDQLIEVLHYLVQEPVRFQAGKDKWVAFTMLSHVEWFMEPDSEAEGAGDVHFELNPHLMGRANLMQISKITKVAGIVGDDVFKIPSDERTRVRPNFRGRRENEAPDNDADVDENIERPK